MRDRLPLIPRVKESAIINYDLSYKNGTHWAAYRKIENLVYFFDSYGLPPPDEFKEYCKGCVIFYNTQRFQKENATNCGQLSLKFLKNEIKPLFFKVL